MNRLGVGMIAAGLLAAVAVGSPAYAADPQPGDPCTKEGQSAPLGSGTIVCTNGTWQPGTGQPPSGSPADPAQPSSGSSSVKTIKNFAPVGTALSADTFGSGGKQVADATAWRMPDKRVRQIGRAHV